MTTGSVRLVVPLDALLDSVSDLSLEHKRRLWEMLEQQIAQAEEEMWEQDPASQAQIREARDAYASGDYLTIDEYAANTDVKPQ